MFVPHASEIWTKSYGRNYTNFFDKIRVFKTYLKHIWQSADANLEDVPVLKQLFNNINFQTTIFRHSKNYGSLTRVTRLKVAPNMSDLISIKDRVSSLKYVSKIPGPRVASLSLPGGQDKMISLIPLHFPVVSLIFPKFFSIFFLILVFRVGGSSTREGPGYATEKLYNRST